MLLHEHTAFPELEAAGLEIPFASYTTSSSNIIRGRIYTPVPDSSYCSMMVVEVGSQLSVVSKEGVFTDTSRPSIDIIRLSVPRNSRAEVFLVALQLTFRALPLTNCATHHTGDHPRVFSAKLTYSRLII